MRRWQLDTTTALLLAVLGFSGSVWWSVRGLRDGIQTFIQQSETRMQTRTTTWTNSDGDTEAVTTTRNTSPTLETLDDWKARHEAAVAKAKE